MEKQTRVTCLLCQGSCWLDKRDGYKNAGLLNLALGWLLWPYGGLLLVRFLRTISFLEAAWFLQFEDKYGVAAGIILWLALLVFCFTRTPRWICSDCGAWYRAVSPSASQVPASQADELAHLEPDDHNTEA